MGKRDFRKGDSPKADYPSLSELDRRTFLAGLGLALAGAALTGCSSAEADKPRPDAGPAVPAPPKAPPPPPDRALEGKVAVDHPKPPPQRKGKVAVDEPDDEALPPPPPPPAKKK